MDGAKFTKWTLYQNQMNQNTLYAWGLYSLGFTASCETMREKSWNEIQSKPRIELLNFSKFHMAKELQY